MDDLKIPIILLICILGGVGYYYYSSSQKPVKPKTPKKIVQIEEKHHDEKETEKEDIEEVVKKAKAAFKAGQHTKSLQILKDYHNIDNYNINKILAYSYSSTKDYNKAISFFEKILKINNNSEDRYKLALLYENTDNINKALKIYCSIADDSSSLDIKHSVFEGIARLALQSSDNEGCFKYVEELVKESPDSRVAVLTLIKLSKQINNYDNLNTIESAIKEYFENDYEINYEFAGLCSQATRYEIAVKYYKFCLKLDPNNYIPYFDCYSVFDKLGKKDLAVKAMEYFLDSGTIFPEKYFEIAKTAHSLRMYRQAFRFYMISLCSYSKLQGLDDDGIMSDVEAFVKNQGTQEEKILVNAFKSFINGDYNESISLLKPIRKELDKTIYKNDYLLLLDACEIIASQDRERDAQLKEYEDFVRAQEEEERHKQDIAKRKATEAMISGSQSVSDIELKDLVKKNINDYNIQLTCAREFVNRRNLKEAKQCVNNAMKINKNAPESYLEMANICMLEQDRVNCKKNIEEAVRLNPSNPENLSIAASISLNNNDIESADRYSDIVLQSSPNDSSAMIVKAKIMIANQNYQGASEIIEKVLAVEKKNVVRAELFKLKRQVKEHLGK